MCFKSIWSEFQLEQGEGGRQEGSSKQPTGSVVLRFEFRDELVCSFLDFFLFFLFYFLRRESQYWVICWSVGHKKVRVVYWSSEEWKDQRGGVNQVWYAIVVCSRKTRKECGGWIGRSLALNDWVVDRLIGWLLDWLFNWQCLPLRECDRFWRYRPAALPLLLAIHFSLALAWVSPFVYTPLKTFLSIGRKHVLIWSDSCSGLCKIIGRGGEGVRGRPAESLIDRLIARTSAIDSFQLLYIDWVGVWMIDWFDVFGVFLSRSPYYAFGWAECVFFSSSRSLFSFFFLLFRVRVKWMEHPVGLFYLFLCFFSVFFCFLASLSLFILSSLGTLSRAERNIPRRKKEKREGWRFDGASWLWIIRRVYISFFHLEKKDKSINKSVVWEGGPVWSGNPI